MLPFTRQQYLDKLTSQNGFHEGGGNPPGTGNITPYGADFGYQGQPWCALLIGWVMRQLGFELLSASPNFPWTPSFYSQCKSAGWQDVAPANIILGDIVFIDWNGDGQIDHVCTAMGSPANGQLSTFDGNMNNQAGFFVKAMGVVHSAVRPPYAVPTDPGTSSANDAPPPVLQQAPHGAPLPQGDHGWVYLGKLHVGQQDSDSVRHYQQACRDYPDVSTIPLNPHGATGNYGPETVAMTELLYRTFDQWQPGAGWADGDLSTPGPGLLSILGLRIVG